MQRFLLIALATSLSFGFIFQSAVNPFTFSSNSFEDSNDYALFFAVNQYDQMDPLNNPISDTKKIAKKLETNYGFKTEIVENPTLDEMDLKISEYRSKFTNGTFKKEGQLLVYLTGHGKEENNNGYFCAKDTDASKLYRTGFAYEYWRPEISKFNCDHILVMIDACFSGAFDPDYKNPTKNVTFNRPGELSESEVLLMEHKKTKTRLFFTSAGIEESPDKSTFAKKFLEGLESQGYNDGILTNNELFTFLELANPKPRRGAFEENEDGATFLFKSNKSKLGVPTQEDIAWSEALERNAIEGYSFYLKLHPQGKYKTDANEAIKRLRKLSSDQFILVQGKQYKMGDMLSLGRADEQPQHIVTLKDFYISAYEVSFAEFDEYCSDTGAPLPDDEGWGRDLNPVINIDWYDAIEYCNWLSEKNDLEPFYRINKTERDPYNTNKNDRKKWTITVNPSNNGYRLPTEAEWEFSARSEGTPTLFGNGKNSADPNLINFDGSTKYKIDFSAAGLYRARTVPVNSLKFNKLDIYNMSGNVWEWCWDWYGKSYYKNSINTTNPKGPTSGGTRVIRGGSWYVGPQDCRVSSRGACPPANRLNDIGFRLARNVK